MGGTIVFFTLNGRKLVLSGLVALFGLGYAVGWPVSSVAGASGSPKLSGAPVVVGIVSTDSGSNGVTADMSTSATRWAKYINAHGGLNLHPVKVIELDDQSSAATALQDVETLIVNDHAIVIADNSFYDASFAKYVDSKKVPVIGLSVGAGEFPYVTDANFYAPSGTVLTSLWGSAKAAALAGGAKLSFLYCAEIPACGQVVPIMQANATSVGMTMPYSAAFSASAPNYTAQCLAAQSAGVDALFAGGANVQSNQRVYDNCATQQYFPVAVGGETTISEAMINDPNIHHIAASSPTLPWFVNQGPKSGSAIFHKVMGSYISKSFSVAGLTSIWTGLQLIAAAAKNVTGKPTSQQIYKGLYALKNETLGGMSVPFSFTKGKPTSVHCVFAYQAVNGKLGMLNGGKPVCQPPAS
jgi:branched-chain amino acid transport system substrate-binding protein